MTSYYPDEITIEGDTLKYFKAHSELIQTLLENQGNEDSLDLSADIMFGGDKEMWKVFLDIFFPEEGYGKLFNVRNNRLIVRNERGGEDAVMNVLRYMLVDEPGRELNFARVQAQRQINAPANVAPRGEGIRAVPNYVPPARNNLNFIERENNNRFNNNNSNNNEGPQLGYTEEEEELLGRLQGQAARNFYPNQRRKVNRRTRRNRKNRRSSRKQRRQTRRS